MDDAEEDGKKDDADEISINENSGDGKKDDVDEISINENSGDGSKDVDISINLGLSIRCFEDDQYEEAIDNGKKCLQMAIENGNKDAEMNACLVIGESELNWKESMRYMEIVIKSSVQVVTTKEWLPYAEALFNLGNCDKEFKYVWWSTNIGEKTCKTETNSALGEYEDVFSYCIRALNIAKEIGDEHAERKSCLVIAKAYRALRNYDKAIEYAGKCIDIAKDKHVEMEACLFLTETYKASGDCKNTIQCALMLHVLAKETDDKKNEMEACFVIMKNCESLKQYKDAVQYAEMCFEVAKETGDKRTELETCAFIANTQRTLTNYTEAVKYAELYLEFAKDTGHKLEAIRNCLIISDTHFKACNYTEAVKYALMCADLAKESGDKRSEIEACCQMEWASRALKSYDEIIQYATKRMAMEHETDDQGNKKIGYLLLGFVDQFQNRKYDNAVSYFGKALDHAKKERDEYGEMVICHCLGEAHIRLNQLGNAISYCDRSLQIAKKIGDKEREMKFSLESSYVYAMLNRSDEVESHATIALEIAKELGDKQGQMKANIFLSDLYQRKSGQESKAIDCLNECVDISKETGDTATEVLASSVAAYAFPSISDARKNIEKLQERLNRFSLPLDTMTATYNEVFFNVFFLHHDSLMMLTKWNVLPGMKPTEIVNYAMQHVRPQNSMQPSFQHYIHSVEQWMKVLPLDAKGEEVMRKLLHLVEQSETQSFEESLVFQIKYFNIFLDFLKDFTRLLVFQAIGRSCVGVAHYLLEDIPNAKASLKEAIRCFESVFDDLHDVDKSKISIVDRYVDAYKLLSKILIKEGNTEEALLVAERCRAKALKDILILEYDLDKRAVQQDHINLDDILRIPEAHRFSILFYTMSSTELHKFVMEHGKDPHFSVQPQLQDFILKKLIKDVFVELDVVRDFRCESPWEYHMLSQALKSDEMREMFPKMVRGIVEKKAQKEYDWDGFACSLNQSLNEAVSLLDDLGNSKDKETSVSPDTSSCFNSNAVKGESSSTSALETLSQTLLGDVSLEQDEVVIIPDGLLSIVPFAALTNPATGRYLSEDKKIRFAPSLTTLKLLNKRRVRRENSTNSDESSEDFHTLKGAIFIGDPDVSKVLYNGKFVSRLQNAEIEVTTIANIFKVRPLTLTGAQATKRVVLEKLHEGASVIHIAAHGDLNKATILLAPDPEVVGVPKEEDYILTMADVQQAQVRAQLVVISCCNSGRGEIRTEGVVGMCRAFLASGAQAVVASLWAVSDEATLDFMLEFYGRLQDGESASTSLQSAMNDSREAFGEPKYWAPFILMGDDVNITFEESTGKLR